MPPRTAVGLQPVPSQPNLPALYESEDGRKVVQKKMRCRDARLWHTRTRVALRAAARRAYAASWLV